MGSPLGLCLVLLVVWAAMVDAFLVCPKDYCKDAICKDVSQCTTSNGYKVSPKRGFCSCCDTCIKVLGFEEQCIPEGLFSRGGPPQAECENGLVCDPGSFKCIEAAS